MKKQLFIWVCILHYIFSMQGSARLVDVDCAQKMVRYCNVRTFESFTITCKDFYALRQQVIADEKQKGDIGSLAWYYFLPAEQRFKTCSDLLDFYRFECFEQGEQALNQGEHPNKETLCAEFFAIYKLHEDERKKTHPSDFSTGYSRCREQENSKSHTLFQLFVRNKNDPAVKILLTRSEKFKTALEQGHADITSSFESKSSCYNELLDWVCREDDGTTVMNLLLHNEAGIIEYNHSVCVLSLALHFENKKLIAFLVNKIDCDIREKLLNKAADRSRPTVCQVIAHLFLDNFQTIDRDIYQSARKALFILIKKNDVKGINSIFYHPEINSPLLCNGDFLNKICFELPEESTDRIIRCLRSKKVDFNSCDSQGKTVLEKIDSSDLNKKRKKTLRKLLSPHSDKYAIGSDHICSLFDKDMYKRDKINNYIKYAKSFLFLTTTCFFVLKFQEIIGLFTSL